MRSEGLSQPVAKKSAGITAAAHWNIAYPISETLKSYLYWNLIASRKGSLKVGVDPMCDWVNINDWQAISVVSDYGEPDQ